MPRDFIHTCPPTFAFKADVSDWWQELYGTEEQATGFFSWDDDSGQAALIGVETIENTGDIPTWKIRLYIAMDFDVREINRMEREIEGRVLDHGLSPERAECLDLDAHINSANDFDRSAMLRWGLA